MLHATKIKFALKLPECGNICIQHIKLHTNPTRIASTKTARYNCYDELTLCKELTKHDRLYTVHVYLPSELLQKQACFDYDQRVHLMQIDTIFSIILCHA
jgi:hypothetical protein